MALMLPFGEYELTEYTPKTLSIPKWTALQDSAGKTTVKIQPGADKYKPDPEDGDELYGVGDEVDIPEDPTDFYLLPEPRLVYANRNPGQPCPICRAWIGTVWQRGNQPRVPKHDHCYCYYQETWQPESKNRPRFRHKPKNLAQMDDPKLITH